MENCEIKNAEICFGMRFYAKETLKDLREFKEQSKHCSTDNLLDALINAISKEIYDEEDSICIKIGDC